MFTVVCQMKITHRITKKTLNSFDQEHREHPASPPADADGPYPAIVPPPSPCHLDSSIVVDGRSEDSSTEKQAHHWNGMESIKGGQCMYIFAQYLRLLTGPIVVRATIDMLPDVPLIEIFDFYVDEAPEAWSTLVHVCRTWRNLVFGSPRRLNFRLYCSIRTQVREKLDVWPNLPIFVENYILFEN